MNYEIKDNILTIKRQHTLHFDYDIQSVVEVNHVLIVLLDIPANESMSENIFAVSDQGEIVWQVESRPDLFGNDPVDLYVQIGDINPDELLGFRWSCTAVVIDIHTGKIKTTWFTK